MVSEAVYSCDNCSRQVGSTSKAFVWQNHVVCHLCYQALHVQGGKLQMAAKEPRCFVVGLTAVLLGLVGGLFCGGAAGWILHVMLQP